MSRQPHSNPTGNGLLRGLLLLVLPLTAAAAAASEWKAHSDPAEVLDLVKGKTRIQYYRADGNMIEHFSDYDSNTIRKWSVREDGRLCWYIFSMPERTIDFAAIQRSSEDTDVLRYKWENAQGEPPLEFAEQPTVEMIRALDKAAGPEE